MVERVAVIGAGGGTGAAAVEAALDAGKAVRAVVRDPARYDAATWAGAAGGRLPEVARGDSLRGALAGVQGVVYAASGTGYWSAAEVDCQGVKNIAEAAAEAGVRRVVLVSSALVTPKNRWHPIRLLLNNFRYGLMDEKFKGTSEEHLRRSGVPYTIVRPGGLTRDPPGAALLIAAQGDAGAGGRVGRADVAAVCVAALDNPAAANVTLELTSKTAAQLRGAAVPPLAAQLRSLFKGLAPDAPAP
eukprot:scaffold2.g6939.t1